MDVSQAVLMWDRGALEIECDRGPQVRDGVETYLGRPVFDESGDLVVRVTLSQVEENGRRRVQARVSQADARGRAWGERSVSADDCASLDEPLTLVVALMVDTPPTTAPREPAPLPPPPPDPPPPASPAPEDPAEILTVPSLEHAPPSPPHAALLGFGAAALGATPELSFGAGLGAIFKPRGFWGLGLDATVFAPRRESLGEGSLEVSLLLAGASVCPLQAIDGRAWWSVCGSLHLARLHAESEGLLDARESAQWFALPGFVARGGRIWGERYLLTGGLQLSFPVSPDKYVYRDAQGDRRSAFDVAAFVLMASVGVGVVLH